MNLYKYSSIRMKNTVYHDWTREYWNLRSRFLKDISISWIKLID